MGFITVMWLMVLATAAFLLFIVPPLGHILFTYGANRLAISAIQASLSIAIVLSLIAGLSKMKKIYIKNRRTRSFTVPGKVTQPPTADSIARPMNCP